MCIFVYMCGCVLLFFFSAVYFSSTGVFLTFVPLTHTGTLYRLYRYHNGTSGTLCVCIFARILMLLFCLAVAVTILIILHSLLSFLLLSALCLPASDWLCDWLCSELFNRAQL